MMSAGNIRWRFILILAVCLVTGVVLYHSAASFFQAGELERLKSRNTLYATTLIDALERYEHLPAILARDPVIRARLHGSAAAANTHLAELAALTKLEAIYLMDRTGLTIAASNFNAPDTFLGQNYGFRPYFQRALSGKIGEFYAIGATTSRPGYFIAGPVYERDEIAGVLAIKLDLSVLTQTWADGGELVLVSNADQVVVLSSHDAFRYRTFAPLTETRRAEIAGERQFGAEPLDVLDWRVLADGGVEIGGDGYLQDAAAINRLGWTLHVLQSRTSVDERAFLTLVVYGVLLAMVALILVYLRGVRIGVALRQSQSERDALQDLNQRLETEVAERKATERSLRETRNELARAGRLAALGRLAAIVTHELGQPLSAMRNYLIASELSGDRQSLAHRLDPVIARMEETTSQLRDFARAGPQATETVDLRKTIRTAEDLMQFDLEAEGVTCTADLPNVAVEVTGDPMRLEQVLINLMRNAQQAVEGQPQKEIKVTLDEDADMAELCVSDSGPGVGDATLDTLTEPFETTRASGMGLGLSISHAIVREHGGELLLTKSSPTGAAFTVRLPLSRIST